MRIDPREPFIPAIVVLLTIAVCLLLSANVEATEPQRPVFEEAYIHNSPGGSVEQFLTIRDMFIEDDTKVHISGYCVSACTLFLSVPDVCVYEDTRLGFHAPYLAAPEIPLRIYVDRLTEELFQQYAPEIREWLTENGGLQPDLIWLEGEEMLKFFPLCDGEPIS